MVIFFISIYSFPAANELAVYDIKLLEIIIVNRIIIFSAYTSAPVRMASFRTKKDCEERIFFLHSSLIFWSG